MSKVANQERGTGLETNHFICGIRTNRRGSPVPPNPLPAYMGVSTNTACKDQSEDAAHEGDTRAANRNALWGRRFMSVGCHWVEVKLMTSLLTASNHRLIWRSCLLRASVMLFMVTFSLFCLRGLRKFIKDL